MSNPSHTPRGPHEPQTATWPLLPTETEIYILPSGEVVVADLPAELADAMQRAGVAGPHHEGSVGASSDAAAPGAPPEAPGQPSATDSVSKHYDNQ